MSRIVSTEEKFEQFEEFIRVDEWATVHEIALLYVQLFFCLPGGEIFPCIHISARNLKYSFI
jgi:hypothetical protein